MMMEAILDMIRTEVSRAISRRFSEHAGEITSYDKETHSVKIKFKPDEDVESGWIPIRTLQTGKEYGMHMPPKVGQPVMLQHFGDDREGGTMMAAVFTDKHKPDKTVEEGELKYIHETMSQMYFKKDGTIIVRGKKNDDGNNEKQTVVLKPDGSIEIIDKSGNGKLIFDGSGNLKINCVTGTIIASSDLGLKAGTTLEAKAGAKLGLDGGSAVVVQGGGSVSNGSVSPPGTNPDLPKFEVLP